MRRNGIMAGLALVLVASTALSACSSDTPGPSGTAVCGVGTGEPATGTPIKLGAIATQLPGTDFTEIPRAAQAYFDCINDNGGINGRPIQLIIETEAIDPVQAAAAARKLIETDQVLGIVGNTSIIECAINMDYYAANGYYVIGSGIAPECYSRPNFAAVNMGPRYSVDGATQYLIREGVSKLVLLQSNVPGTDYIAGGFLLIAADAGIPTETLTANVPIEDGASVAQQVVQAAGAGGGVVLNFTPPEALKILQAAEDLGLEDAVKWACSTPCNTDFLAEALGPQWNDKLGVNAELNLITASGPDSEQYRAVLAAYAPEIPLGSFSQMGFLEAKIAVSALQSITGEFTKESVNAAFKAVENFETDILCKPWYYGDGELHIPNNTDRTVVPQDGVMVLKEDCFPISDLDPAIKRVREIEAAG